MKRGRIAASLIAIALIILPASLGALTVLQLNLEQLTALSEKVFIGKCLSVREGKDSSGRRVQTVTFQVEEMLKGESSEQVTFKQLGGLAGGLGDELPHYRKGQESVIFLSAEGRLGLTAPVALQQGKFDIQSDPNGKAAENGNGNKGLFLGWKKSPRYKSMNLTASDKEILKKSSGEVPLENFLSLVRRLVSP